MKYFSGLDYLRIDIANCYGLDKSTWEDRLEWFRFNEHMLEHMLDGAENKFLYAKALNAYDQANKGIPTGHIMALDGTASFLQIMACLTGCHTTAKQCNLINTGRREDFYTNLTNEMNRLLGKNMNISRKLVKSAGMPVFYGSVLAPELVFGPGTPELKAFYTALDTLAPGAVALMQTILDYWDKEAYTHEWRLPDGHTAVVPVIDNVALKMKFIQCHKSFTFKATINQPKKNSVSLIANIIQSLDGWLVRGMTRLANIQGFELLCIHDAFYASPIHMNKVRTNYRDLLSELASSNILEQIFSDLSGKPEKYVKSSTSLSSLIMDSEYTLS